MKKPGAKFYPLLVAAILLAVYVFTALPTIGWRDGPEFADCVYTLGISHPAGSPTFSLAGKLSNAIPLGSIPFRIVVWVSLCSVISSLILFFLISEISSATGQPDDHHLASWASAMIVLAFGLTTAVWENSTEIEVYSLNILFIGFIIFCALRWVKRDEAAWLYAGAFVYGLAAGNHATVALYLPGLLVLFWFKCKTERFRTLVLVAFFFLVGFSVYLYLPIRASASPEFNFGDPESWRRFLAHITDQKDRGQRVPGMNGGPSFYRSLVIFATQTIPVYFWVLGLPLMLTGLWRLVKKDWPLALSLSIMAMANVLFFISWRKGAAFIPAIFIAALFCGLGFSFLVSRLAIPDSVSRMKKRVLTTLLILLLAIACAGSHFSGMDRSEQFLSMETMRTDLENMAPEAINISGMMWFHHRAFQDIYSIRDDVTTILVNDFFFPELYFPVTRERFPLVAVPAGDIYRNADSGEFLKTFLAANLDRGRQIYWEPLDIPGGTFYPNLSPSLDFYWKFGFQPVEKLDDTTVKAALERLSRRIEHDMDAGMLEIQDYHVYFNNMLRQYSHLLHLHERSSDSFRIEKMILDMFGPGGTDTLSGSEQANLQMNLGAYMMDTGNWPEAEGFFKKAIASNPENARTWGTLGIFLMEMDRIEEAASSFQRSLSIFPAQPLYLEKLAECHEKLNDYAKAEKYYLEAITQTDDPERKRMYRNRIMRLLQNPAFRANSLSDEN